MLSPSPFTPNIRVYFTGLLAFYHDDVKNIMRVGIHNHTPDQNNVNTNTHELRVTILADTPNELLAPMFLPDSIRLDNMHLDITNPVYPLQEYREANKFDFGFAFNLDGPGPNQHNGQLTIDHQEFLSPGLYLNNGIFYTADNFDAIIGRNGEAGTATPIAFVIGADIYLKKIFSTATLFYRDTDGTTSRFDFRNDDTTRYTVWVTNIHRLGNSAPGEFQFWYNAISDPAHPGIKYNIEPVITADHLSHDNPCNPIFFSRTPPIPESPVF